MRINLRDLKTIEKIVKNKKDTGPFIIFNEGKYLVIELKIDGLVAKHKILKENDLEDISINIGIIQKDMMGFLSKFTNRNVKMDLRFEKDKMIAIVSDVEKSMIQEESVHIRHIRRNIPAINIIQSANIDKSLKTLITANRLCLTYDYYPYTAYVDLVCDGNQLNILIAEMKAVAKVTLDIKNKDVSFSEMITKKQLSTAYSLIKDIYIKKYDSRLDFCEKGVIFACETTEIFVPYSDKSINFPYDTALKIFDNEESVIRIEENRLHELRNMYKSAGKEPITWVYKGLSTLKKANNKNNFAVLFDNEKNILIPLTMLKSYPDAVIGFNFRYFDSISPQSVVSITSKHCLIIKENELQFAICPIK